jgi:hypothetical protein
MACAQSGLWPASGGAADCDPPEQGIVIRREPGIVIRREPEIVIRREPGIVIRREPEQDNSMSGACRITVTRREQR